MKDLSKRDLEKISVDIKNTEGNPVAEDRMNFISRLYEFWEVIEDANPHHGIGMIAKAMGIDEGNTIRRWLDSNTRNQKFTMEHSFKITLLLAKDYHDAKNLMSQSGNPLSAKSDTQEAIYKILRHIDMLTAFTDDAFERCSLGMDILEEIIPGVFDK